MMTEATARRLDFGLMNETRRNVMPNLTGLSEKYIDYASLKEEVDRSQRANQPNLVLLFCSSRGDDRDCRMFAGDRAVMHQLSFGSYEAKKNVHFVFICDLIKNNVIRSHLRNVFFDLV